MDAKLKAKWIKALRGGAYRKTTGMLANDRGTGFCCLGVLADIQGCEWMPDEESNGLVPISKAGRKPWVQFSGVALPSSRSGGLPREKQKTLMIMNDNQGASFKKIADYIEAEL